MQVGLSLLRVLLFVARPRTLVLGNLPDTKIYRNVEQYPKTDSVPGILILDIGAPIYFANASYLRERYKLHITHNLLKPSESLCNSGLVFVHEGF